MLNFNNYICAVDIGSSKIAVCAASLKKGRIEKLYFESLASKGITEGFTVDSSEAIACIGKILKSVKAKSGFPIKFVSVNISGTDITTKRSRAIIPLAERGNKVITASDVAKVNEQARILGSSLQEEILHLVPSSYTIDSRSSLINPIGLYSHKLEADLYLICAKLSSVQSLSRAVNHAGYEIRDLYFSGIATSRAVLPQESESGCTVLCDIGADITELLIFKDGLLRDLEVVPMGGNDLTKKLQDGLKLPFDLAEDIKRSYGFIGEHAPASQEKEVLVKKSDCYKPIKQKEVIDILTGEAKILCGRIKERLEQRVPAYEIGALLVVGRTILLEGFIETFESSLGVAVRFGRIANPAIAEIVKEDHQLAGQKYLSYVTALGMLCQEVQARTEGVLPSQHPIQNPFLRALHKAREVYQEYF